MEPNGKNKFNLKRKKKFQKKTTKELKGKKIQIYLVQHFVTNLQKRWSAEKKVSINIFMT